MVAHRSDLSFTLIIMAGRVVEPAGATRRKNSGTHFPYYSQSLCCSPLQWTSAKALLVVPVLRGKWWPEAAYPDSPARKMLQSFRESLSHVDPDYVWSIPGDKGGRPRAMMLIRVLSFFGRHRGNILHLGAMTCTSVVLPTRLSTGNTSRSANRLAYIYLCSRIPATICFPLANVEWMTLFLYSSLALQAGPKCTLLAVFRFHSLGGGGGLV